MMIKDILVTLPMGDAPSIALEYAAKVASKFDAHLTGLVLVQDRVGAVSLFDSGAMLRDYRREVEAAAEAAKVRFEETWRREGLTAESLVLDEGAFSLPELFARTARRFDLTILPQPDPENGRSAEIMIDAALLGSGRPILIVPYFWEGGVKFDRVLVCWDGSLNAARAIADGMPFLTRAKQVEIVTVTSDENEDDGIPGLDVGHHLSRHGASVEVRTIVAHGQEASFKIRSYATMHSVDLIVMGGYGHSRLREFVLGSATRDILESTSVPILMSH
jgi:nucleotide-binding universal stress UspA family protein